MIAAPGAVYAPSMSGIVVRGHHDLGLARAKRLAETMALRLRDDYGGTYAWTGDRTILQPLRSVPAGPAISTARPSPFRRCRSESH